MPGHRHRTLILTAILSLLALPSFGGARVDYVGSYADLRYPLEIALVTTFIGLAGIRLFSRELLDK